MKYCCPKCRSNYRFHEADCSWSGIEWEQIEKAYIDILSILTRAPQTRPDLSDAVHGDWSAIHEQVFRRFEREDRIESIGMVEQSGEDRDVWRLLTPDEYKEQSKTPSHEHLEIINEHGPVDGCKDDAVVAMISYYEMIGLSWEETLTETIDWLERTGAWSRGSWEESSPEQLVRSKKHVYDGGYGWKNAAQQAATVIKSATGGASA